MNELNEQLRVERVIFAPDNLEQRVVLERFYNDNEHEWTPWHLETSDVDPIEYHKSEDYFKTVLKCMKEANNIKW